MPIPPVDTLVKYESPIMVRLRSLRAPNRTPPALPLRTTSRRVLVPSAALARRVLVAGERLNRERDWRRAELDAFRGVLEEKSTTSLDLAAARPRLAWTRARGAEEEALRATRDVLVALGDFFRSAERRDFPERDLPARAVARGTESSRERTLPRIPRSRHPASRGE